MANEVVPFGETDIQSRIKTIGGMQVMFDRDLAELYGVETKQLKRQVRRNIQRFPSDFMLELSEKEVKGLRCQFGTSNRGGDRYGSYAFTEEGIAMLSSVLRSDRAVEVNIGIMRAFVAMRRTLQSMAPLMARLEATELRQLRQEDAQARNEERFERNREAAISLAVTTPPPYRGLRLSRFARLCPPRANSRRQPKAAGNSHHTKPASPSPVPPPAPGAASPSHPA